MPSVLNFTTDTEIKVPKHTKFLYHVVFQIDLISGSHHIALTITIAFSVAFQPSHNLFSKRERGGMPFQTLSCQLSSHRHSNIPVSSAFRRWLCRLLPTQITSCNLQWTKLNVAFLIYFLINLFACILVIIQLCISNKKYPTVQHQQLTQHSNLSSPVTQEMVFRKSTETWPLPAAVPFILPQHLQALDEGVRGNNSCSFLIVSALNLVHEFA